MFWPIFFSSEYIKLFISVFYSCFSVLSVFVVWEINYTYKDVPYYFCFGSHPISHVISYSLLQIIVLLFYIVIVGADETTNAEQEEEPPEGWAMSMINSLYGFHYAGFFFYSI